MTTAHADPVTTEEPARRPGVVERVTQVLDVFMLGEQYVMLEDVIAMTGLPRSTAFRILSQLVDRQWLEHDARGYRLGARVHGMTGRTNDHSDLRSATATALNDLHLATSAVAHLGVLEGATVHYLDKVGGPATSSVPSRVGDRISAERTVCGRALLAWLVPERVDALMSLGTVHRDRSFDLAQLHAQLNRIRQRNGLAVSLGDQCAMGITSVAAPIVGPGGAVGAISVAGRDGLSLNAVAPMVAFAARRTSQLLFRDRPSTGRRKPRGVVARTPRHGDSA